ncbi:hypothetical protein [Lacicoccus qingdaonensis]|uniref:Uncharacterized protein n=1 Tax=Lacicoccus qingdaonensis TaxID=576118 RepID=A0A1G9CSN5_9BACL|nr:hypothetical protein [Salinicoccus qingdaonensis]SDK54731.1 hypothetical protein SAMN05216216_104171 [Salinicoccus qingdaonensis]
MYFRFKKDNSELNDDGFLLVDSLLSLMTLLVITNILLPAMLVLVQYDSSTQSQLKFNRELYISLSGYDNFEDFKEDNDNFLVGQGEICDKIKEDLCVRIK